MPTKAKPVDTPANEQALMTELWDPALADDLRAFVMFVYPWGKANTPLERFREPRKWQIEELEAKTDHIRNNKILMQQGKMPVPWRGSKASGRGIGKSATVAWEGHWMLTTRLGSTTIFTANTEAQLVSRTMAEVGKWHTMAINAHWFDRSTMSVRPAEWFDVLLREQLRIDTAYYYLQAQLWSEEKPDAFAGAHNHQGMMLKFDEASGIPQSIWNVSEGFFTEPILDRYWDVYSNPRNNTGAFFETFHRFRSFWRTRQIDARTVEGTDPSVYQKIIDQHGEDSDEARVEVYGQFPNAGARQFVPMAHIVESREREVILDPGAPLVMGVDVARYGEDSSKIAFRCGRDARSIPWQTFRGISTMDFANDVADAIGKYDPDAVVIDANGVGGPVADRLKQLGYVVHEVSTQGAPADKARYLNKRAELWDRMKDWLRSGCIPLDSELEDDLKGPEYHYNNAKNVLQLESKEKMKDRGLASPDGADALALTFAVNPARKDIAANRSVRSRMAKDVDYNVLG